TPQAPAHPVAKVAKKVDRPLQAPFAAAIERRLKDGALPDEAALVTIKNKPHLYLKRQPPPPPSKPPALALAEKLIEARRQRRDGGAESPPTLSQLLDQTAAGADPKVVKQALGHKAFKTQAVLAAANKPAAPAVLRGNELALAASPALL